MSLVPVAWTNDSSTCSKSSLVYCGYISDDFLSKFVSKLERRSPLINRGYFIRTWAFENVVRYFLEKNAPNLVQIVNLGAGYDTLCLRLAKENLLSNCRKFVDVDQVPVVRKKHQILSDISDWPPLIEYDKKSIVHCYRDNYGLLGCDLRSGRLYDLLKHKCQLSESLPTLFIAECVMNYLKPDEANTVIRIVSERFANGYVLTYEQIHPDDAFGQFMVKHFISIKSPLRHIECYPSSSSQEIRFLDLGFGSVKTIDMLEIYRKSLTVEEKLRIESLEPFDEFEMWHLKCTHYALTFAATQKSIDFYCSLMNRFNLSPFSKSCLSVADHSCIRTTYISEQKTTVRRFGHRCATMKQRQQSVFITIGGYGQCPVRNSGHKRLDSLLCMDSGNFDLLTNIHDPLFARCYHSMVTLEDGRLLIFGGRHSPFKALNDAFIVELSTNAVNEDGVNFLISVVKFDSEL
uniref:tRNA wybutosine-synthesizing protein 4 n=1 Tax=Romanomermis culicivorax TaxID=13658 RepID=A0A915ITV2_ROMCU